MLDRISLRYIMKTVSVNRAPERKGLREREPEGKVRDKEGGREIKRDWRTRTE